LLFALAAYVAITSVASLLGYSEPKPTLLGIAILVAAAVVMPWLAREKRRLSGTTGSAALPQMLARALCKLGYEVAIKPKNIDVWIPTVDQRWLILPRYTQPSSDTKLLIEKLRLQLPSRRHRASLRQPRVTKTRYRPSGRRPFVMETFQLPRLIPRRLTTSEAPNCESSANKITTSPLQDLAFRLPPGLRQLRTGLQWDPRAQTPELRCR
jgi:hypothetical protein